MATIALRRRRPQSALLLLFLGVLLLATLVLPANQAKVAKHAEALRIHKLYRHGLCEGLEFYFSPARGTILVLCGIPRSDVWGGIIYRVASDNGNVLLGDASYEVTCYGARREYWDRVRVRDGYLPLALFPNVERFMLGR